MARTFLGPWEFIRDMGSSSQCGLIMAPGQEANDDKFKVFFYLLDNNGMLSVCIRIALIRRF